MGSGVSNVNCKKVKGVFCTDKRTRRVFMGLGPRVCIELDSASETCPYAERYAGPATPPVSQLPSSLKKNIHVKKDDGKIDTDQFIPLVGAEITKLPGSDKSMHFSASYGICSLYSEHFDSKAMFPSSICIVKAILDSFRVGLKKEYADKGIDFSKTDEAFDKMTEALSLVYLSYKDNGLDEARHEGDLLADLTGIGTYVINQSLRNLQELLMENQK